MDCDKRHGGTYDRGRMDKYYGRRRMPHKFEGNTYLSPIVYELTEAELDEYNAGYDEQDELKDWG